jgi:DNA-binding MarR family transcriptional regulator
MICNFDQAAYRAAGAPFIRPPTSAWRVAMKDDVDPDAPTAKAALLSFCNNATLRKATRRLGIPYDAVLEPSGLKATQVSLLRQIYDRGDPTMAELAKSLLMDLSAMRHSLGPLIRDGFVRLRSDKKDGRVKRVVLTPRWGDEIQGSHAALAKSPGSFRTGARFCPPGEASL